MINERKLVVVSGPSGCGKDTVVKHLMALRDDILLSVSCTTRPPRVNEVNGTHYYFVSKDEFDERVKNGRMLEFTQYAGNFYGTPVDELENKLVGGNTVILIIEVEGARNVKLRYPGSLCIFIVPPSLEALEERLRARATESEGEIQKRLAIADKEMRCLDFYDVAVANDVAADCAQRLSDIIEDWQNKQEEQQ